MPEEATWDLRSHFREIPDFPQKGITFIDITPVLQDGALFAGAVDLLCDWARNVSFDVIVAPEARGFILGAPVASRFRKGFVPVRKPGKLPWHVARGVYRLEYGEAALEIHEDAVRPGQRALVIDDLLATGGTVRAAMDLVTRLGGEIAGCGFLVELTFLKGRKRLEGVPIFSAVAIEA